MPLAPVEVLKDSKISSTYMPHLSAEHIVCNNERLKNLYSRGKFSAKLVVQETFDQPRFTDEIDLEFLGISCDSYCDLGDFILKLVRYVLTINNEYNYSADTDKINFYIEALPNGVHKLTLYIIELGICETIYYHPGIGLSKRLERYVPFTSVDELNKLYYSSIKWVLSHSPLPIDVIKIGYLTNHTLDGNSRLSTKVKGMGYAVGFSIEDLDPFYHNLADTYIPEGDEKVMCGILLN